MTTGYIIIAGTGEYSDRCTWPVAIYLDREKAQVEFAKLDAIHKRFEKRIDNYGPDWAALLKELKNEYAAIGWEAETEDWELAEAELKD